MIGAQLTTQSPSIRNYATAPAPPPAPVIAQSPQPQVLPDDFAVSGTSSIGATVGTPINLAIASTTGSGASAPSIIVSGLPAGLALGYAWLAGAGTLTVTGTPLAPSGIKRTTVTYVAPDGTVRGSSLHEFNVVNPADGFTVLTQLNYSGRVGLPASAALATLSYSPRADVTAHLTGELPGFNDGIALAWVPGTPSTGTLFYFGTPVSANSYPIRIEYRCNGYVIGASDHVLSIGEAAPAPAPAPPVAAPPPAPTPAPPAPTPAPRPGADSLLSSVLLLIDFEETGQDTFESINEGGEVALTPLPPYVLPQPFGSLALEGTITNAKNIAPVPGASGAGGRFGNTTWFITRPAESLLLHLSTMTAECYVKPVSTELWASNRFGQGYLFAMMSGRAAGGGDACCWSIGFISTQRVNGTAVDRQVRPYMHAVFANGKPSVTLVGAPLPRGIGHVHLAGQVERSGDDAIVSLWCQGRRVASQTLTVAALLRVASSVWLGRVGVTDNDTMRSTFEGYGVLSRDVPFGSFDMDDARLTSAARYTTARGVAADTIPAPMLQIPWPTY